MLDPNCGFCYDENGSNISDSSCEAADPANTEHAANGRFVFVSPKSHIQYTAQFVLLLLFNLSDRSGVFMIQPGALIVPKKTQVHYGPITTAQHPIPG